MKILIVSDAWHPQINGVVRTYEYLATELSTMGHTVHVIGPADFPLSMAMPGYPEIRLALFARRSLARKMKEFEPDLLHIATEGPLGLAARKYACHHKLRFTTCYHTHFPDYVAKRVPSFLQSTARSMGICFVRWFHAPSACLFVATPSLEKTLQEWGFKTPIRRMTRGIDHAVFHVGKNTLYPDLPRPIAVYVGRIAVEKNLEAFLSMDWNGTKLLVGDGPDLSKLKAAYPQAVFAGLQTGTVLADHYRCADVFVFPSRTDTFGMVLVEAMACGLPLAGYPVTGPADIITEDFIGSVDNDLATAATCALTSPGTAEQRGDYAKSHYSWRTAARQFLELEE